jgi:hypothetical protein
MHFASLTEDLHASHLQVWQYLVRLLGIAADAEG